MSVEIGIIGDFDARVPYHTATDEALAHAADALALRVRSRWISTESLHEAGSETSLQRFDALWCAPWSPYRSTRGAHRGIRYAREHNVPLVAT